MSQNTLIINIKSSVSELARSIRRDGFAFDRIAYFDLLQIELDLENIKANWERHVYEAEDQLKRMRRAG